MVHKLQKEKDPTDHWFLESPLSWALEPVRIQHPYVSAAIKALCLEAYGW